jgi:hypothetical protein
MSSDCCEFEEEIVTSMNEHFACKDKWSKYTQVVESFRVFFFGVFWVNFVTYPKCPSPIR